MARNTKTHCNRCDARLSEGPFCPKCGYPTPSATHEDRVDWELRQWASPNPAAAASTKVIHTPVVTEARSRRWFKARRAPNPNTKPAAASNVKTNGNGHKPVEAVVEPKSDSPFAAPAEVAKAPAQAKKSPKPKATPKKSVRKEIAQKEMARSVAAASKKSKAAAAKKAVKKAEPEKPKKAVVQKATEPEAPKPEKAKISSMRAARRLPSLADVEQIAKQGPPMIKILRLIQVRVMLLESQAADENVAKTG
jgi:hypothetical protein